MMIGLIWYYMFLLSIIYTSFLDVPLVISMEAHFQPMTAKYIPGMCKIFYAFYICIPLTPLQQFMDFPVPYTSCLEADDSTVCRTVRAIEALLNSTDSGNYGIMISKGD